MNVPILTAVGDPTRESDLTLALNSTEHGVVVVRRCVDLADLLAAAMAGLARAAVLSADLRRLDGEALGRLRAAGIAVVGLVAPGDDAAERRLRQLGVAQVVPGDAAAATIAAAVLAATAAPVEVPPPVTDTPSPPLVVAAETVATNGKVIAVWGPAGAPGRSTVAVNLAAELAATGQPVVLVDADTYGGVSGQLLGLLDEAPGIAAACRLANAGSLDLMRLTALSDLVRPSLRVLTGITRPDRWVELRAGALSAVLDLLRSMASYVVVDCGFCLEQQEELSYDTVAPRRNAATFAGLAAADVLIGVAAADPIGLARYVRSLPDCIAVTAAPTVITVANRLRRGVVGAGEPRRQVVSALDRYAGITDVHAIPSDGAAIDAALAAGHTLLEAAPRSPARLAIRDLAIRVGGGPQASRRGRRRAG